MPPPERTRAVAWLLFAATSVAYLLTTQRAVFGDGLYFVPRVEAADLVYLHALYLPLVWAVHRLLEAVLGTDAETASRVVSALAGGAGVALAYVIGRRVLASAGAALAAALLLAFLPGWWFHATATELHAVHGACALVLLLGLVRVLDAAADPSGAAAAKGSVGLLALGAFLTPASHTSGLAMLLPVAYVLWRLSGAARWRAAGALGAGLALYVALTVLLFRTSEGPQNTSGMFVEMYLHLLADPGPVARAAFSTLREFQLYALPAAALVPAGLRVLWSDSPRLAGLLLCWLLAWPAIALPVLVNEFGSYHTPNVAVQALLAVVAWRALALSPGRALLALSLAAAPAFAWSSAEAWHADLIWFGAAASLFVMARPDARTGARIGTRLVPVQASALWMLPVGGAALSITLLFPLLDDDPVRDQLAAVDPHIAAQDRVVLLPSSHMEHHLWRRHFEARQDAGQVLSPMRFEAPAMHRQPETVVRLDAIERHLADDVGAGRRVWLVGDGDALARTPAVKAFFARLRERFEIVEPNAAVPGLRVLEARPGGGAPPR